MKFGETKLLKEKHNVRLLEVGCRYDHGNTRHYDDYEDALEEYNLRWMQIEYDE